MGDSMMIKTSQMSKGNPFNNINNKKMSKSKTTSKMRVDIPLNEPRKSKKD